MGFIRSKETEVLVIDDESTVCERLKDYLEKKGLKVETYTESEKALQRLKEKEFTVVITDLKMKGFTGMDVLLFIKEQKLKTKVIMITGYGSFEAIRKAEYVGIFEFVTKPFKMEYIYRLVKKAAK